MIDAKPDVLALFTEALALSSPEERSNYLGGACGDDLELRRRVDRLLQAHQNAGNFLGGSTSAAVADDGPLTEKPGSVIGPYKLLEQIGEGGFGVVFMAEQTQPVQRKVALKIVKPGMDTRQVIARFEAERQTLALMDHPNIAKVFDAGATENCRPYFVMELVRGVPITDYCDETNLTTRERLELFITVCQAVQHAHQKGVIHRDIKPTNILVAMQDGKPAPKVIDFGVAKALSQRPTEQSVATGFAQIIGTPLYMSPEQAELSPLGVDTRSDIYSLGVLLYELLTGKTPFDKDQLHSAGFDEIRRIIREVDPPRPSSRVSTLAAEEATTVAQRRRTDARRLFNTVRGELDWIVMKCLEKDRNRRYESASDLATDVQHHLQNEPVKACPPSTMYRLRKFARRNWAALAAAAVVSTALLLLVVGLAISNRLIATSRNETAAALREREQALAEAKESAKTADDQRQRAEESSRKALTAVRDLLTSPAISHDEWGQIPNALRRKFRDEAAKFCASLSVEKNSDPALRYETAIGQRALGYLYHQSDASEQAEILLRQSVETLERLHRESPDNLDYRQQLASSHYLCSRTVWWLRRFDEALVSARRAVDLYEGLIADQIDLPNLTAEVYDAYLSLGTLHVRMERMDDAEQTYLRAIEFVEQRAAHVTSKPLAPSDRVKAYDLLAILQARVGKCKEAADTYDRALKIDAKDTMRWYGAAAVYLSINDVDRYHSACGELLDFAEKLIGNNPKIADWAIKTCALAPDSVADFSRIERLAQRIVTGTEDHPWRRNFLLAKALTVYRAGRHQEAIEWLQQFAPKAHGEHFDATAFAALALAHHQLGHADVARESLAAARIIIANKPSDALSSVYRVDWLHSEILCREAESIIK